MAKKRYKFNPQTLTYEVMAIPFRIRFYRILRKVLIGFILASVVNLLFSFFFYTPKMYRIGERNNELMLKYNILNDKIRAATAKLQELRHRDNNVYRSLFAADSLNLHGIYTPYPDTKYSFLEGRHVHAGDDRHVERPRRNDPDAVPGVQIARRTRGAVQKQSADGRSDSRDLAARPPETARTTSARSARGYTRSQDG